MNIGLYGGVGHFWNDDGENDRRRWPNRRPRIFRPRINFNRDDIDTRQRFRLTRAHVEFLINRIGPLIAHDTERNFALTPRQQILLSLRYLATGDNYRSIADSHGVSKSTLSRCLHRVVTTINRVIYPTVVDWPNDENQRRGIANEFYEKRGMPNVMGCIDGSLIEIIAPSEHEEQFVDRRGRHSLNALFVCGPKLRFYYVNARWPGSVHDARVFRNSSLKRRLDRGWRPIPNGVLLGDSGYVDSDYLVTPVANPQTAQERRFNFAHRQTRNYIECAIGVLKQRFRCLLKYMHLHPLFAAQVVMCCSALHNLLMEDDEADDIVDDFEGGADDHNYFGRAIDYNRDLGRQRELVGLF